ISRRASHSLNSAIYDAEYNARNRGPDYNPAYMHPADLASLGLAAGDVVEIRSPRAAILGVVEPDTTVRRGVISMSQTYGGTPDEDHKVLSIGSCTSRLADVEDGYERWSGQPRMSDIPVSV